MSPWAVQGGCAKVRSSELYRQCGRMPGGTAREQPASSETRHSGDPAATGRRNDKCELRLDSPTLPSSSLHSRLSRLLVKRCLRRWYRWSSSRPSGEDRMTPRKRTHLGSTVSCTRDRQDGVRRTPSPLAGWQRLRCDLAEALMPAGCDGIEEEDQDRPKERRGPCHLARVDITLAAGLHCRCTTI